MPFESSPNGEELFLRTGKVENPAAVLVKE